jgi:hypothetical protein
MHIQQNMGYLHITRPVTSCILKKPVNKPKEQEQYSYIYVWIQQIRREGICVHTAEQKTPMQLNIIGENS